MGIARMLGIVLRNQMSRGLARVMLSSRDAPSWLESFDRELKQ